MFTVNIGKNIYNKTLDVFQNISCLRLIRAEADKIFLEIMKFQNISCLRLMNSATYLLKIFQEFQNISCLRLIVRNQELTIEALDTFQNISCLRLISIFSSFIGL